jgi:hypothetical protein
VIQKFGFQLLLALVGPIASFQEKPGKDDLARRMGTVFSASSFRPSAFETWVTA